LFYKSRILQINEKKKKQQHKKTPVEGRKIAQQYVFSSNLQNISIKEGIGGGNEDE